MKDSQFISQIVAFTIKLGHLLSEMMHLLSELSYLLSSLDHLLSKLQFYAEFISRFYIIHLK